MRRRWVVAAGFGAVLLVAGVLVARHTGAGAGAGAAAGPPPAYDPPARFDPGPGTPLPRDADADPLPAVLNGFDAFLALPDGLRVIDTRTGDVRASVSPIPPAATSVPSSVPPSGSASVQPDVRLEGPVPRAPVPVSVAGRAAVVAVFGVKVAGHGTTVGHDGVQVLAIDALTYAGVAAARIDLPVSLTDRNALREAWPVGLAGSVLVVGVRLGPDRSPASYGIDLAAGRLAWQLPGFEATALVGDRVIGAAAEPGGGLRVTAVGADDGRRLWVAAGPGALTASVWPAGPALVAVSSTDAGTGQRTLAVLDAATGVVRSSAPSQGGVTCRYDERATTVCSQPEAGQPWAAGYDAVTGRQLWQLPDATAGRVAPTVSTAWHGAVYGSTDAGPVVLDARTGADRPGTPNVAPDLVDAYVGLTAATALKPRPFAHLALS